MNILKWLHNKITFYKLDLPSYCHSVVLRDSDSDKVQWIFTLEKNDIWCFNRFYYNCNNELMREIGDINCLMQNKIYNQTIYVLTQITNSQLFEEIFFGTDYTEFINTQHEYYLPNNAINHFGYTESQCNEKRIYLPPSFCIKNIKYLQSLLIDNFSMFDNYLIEICEDKYRNIHYSDIAFSTVRVFFNKCDYDNVDYMDCNVVDTLYQQIPVFKKSVSTQHLVKYNDEFTDSFLPKFIKDNNYRYEYFKSTLYS